MWASRRELREVLRLLGRLDAAVVVRDPGTARSVEEFEGMRRLLMAISKQQRAHVIDLVSLSDVIERGGSMDLVRGRVNEYLSSLGVERSTDVSRLEEFDVDASGSGRLECSRAAVVEVLADGRRIVHKRGSAGWVADPVPHDVEPAMDGVQRPAGVSEVPMEDEPLLRRSPLVLVAVAVTGLLAGYMVGQVGGGGDPAEPSPTSIESPADEATGTTVAATPTTTVRASTTTEEGK